jgi:hypothetical protein
LNVLLHSTEGTSGVAVVEGTEKIKTNAISAIATIILIDLVDGDCARQQRFKDDTASSYRNQLRLFRTYNFWKNRQQANRHKGKFHRNLRPDKTS